LTVTDPAEDVRGRQVLDIAGEHIGHVYDLLVEHGKHIVRFYASRQAASWALV
jgi:sporulation protein YlmC with PRC-barrel domain